MIASPSKTKFRERLLILFALLALQCVPGWGQQQPERFWLAGRYDGDRVVIYFDAVKFAGTMAPNPRKIADPVVAGFFSPVELPANYIARFQTAPDAERFALGDRYDLLLGNGTIAPIKLTTLVGCETDEEVGNDSFVGALGTVEKSDSLFATKGYYAVRRPEERQSGAPNSRPKTTAELSKYAHLGDDPVRFDVETKIVEILTARMKMDATDLEQNAIGSTSPAFTVQPFHLGDGTLRYYVRAQWKSGKEPTGRSTYALTAWMAPPPRLRILAVEQRAAIENELPDLLNVVDLGDGRTGIILHIQGGDGTALKLAEYRDGANARSMRVLQSIASGE
jgi:hypothetical protein